MFFSVSHAITNLSPRLMARRSASIASLKYALFLFAQSFHPLDKGWYFSYTYDVLRT